MGIWFFFGCTRGRVAFGGVFGEHRSSSGGAAKELVKAKPWGGAGRCYFEDGVSWCYFGEGPETAWSLVELLLWPNLLISQGSEDLVAAEAGVGLERCSWEAEMAGVLEEQLIWLRATLAPPAHLQQ